MPEIDVKVSTRSQKVTVTYEKWEKVLPGGEDLIEVVGASIAEVGPIILTEDEEVEVQGTLEEIL